MRWPACIPVAAALCIIARPVASQSPDRPPVRATAPQAAGPDLTGTWVLDTTKSSFGILPTPAADTATYTRAGPLYRVVETGSNDSGSARVSYSWPVGPGEVSSDLPDQEARVLTRVTQQGDTALFVSQLQHEGKTIEIQSGREYLSPDGNTRTREFDLQSLANPDEDVQHVVAVFRRQR